MFYANLALVGAVQGLLLATIALSVTLCFSVARFSNAATGDLMTVGAYSLVLAQSTLGAPLAVGIMLAMLSVCVISLASYWFIFRRLSTSKPIMALIASVGLAFLLRGIVSFFAGHGQYAIEYPIRRALVFYGLRIVPIDIWISLAAVILLGAVFCILYLTQTGLHVRALADNRDLARTSGIKTKRVMTVLWTVVGIVTALGGVMIGMKTIVTPEMGWNLLLPGFAAAVLGGLGNPIGAVVAAILLGISSEMITPFVGFVYKTAFSYAVLMVILVIRPEGIFGRVEQVR
uniref:Branched-chain amino acid ABC transporter permease n=1 Tax=Bosea sp. NBC_00436 TaxID=2969620 RepID=A0A9E7ZZG6_9HYPH